MTTEDKKAVHAACYAQLQSKIALTQESIQMIQASANEETKSSAGDKYETGRAMAHLEVEKLSAQLSELLKQKQVLDQIDLNKLHKKIQLGSLVKTQHANFFISISFGKIKVSDNEVFCISSNSPIGVQLFGKETGQSFEFQNRSQQIIGVV